MSHPTQLLVEGTQQPEKRNRSRFALGMVSGGSEAVGVQGTEALDSTQTDKRKLTMCSMIFRKGDDFLKKGADHKTFGIHCPDWAQQIEVYGDEGLRDRILRLLVEDEARH